MSFTINRGSDIYLNLEWHEDIKYYRTEEECGLGILVVHIINLPEKRNVNLFLPE